MIPYPKIELHVHLEGTVRADTLREIARRNDYALPDDLESQYRFRDFRHFIEVWILTTNALKKEEDYRQMVVDYAAEAAVEERERQAGHEREHRTGLAHLAARAVLGKFSCATSTISDTALV